MKNTSQVKKQHEKPFLLQLLVENGVAQLILCDVL